MEYIKCSQREPDNKGFYKINGLNNQGKIVTNNTIWFSGTFWVVREGTKVTEWLPNKMNRITDK